MKEEVEVVVSLALVAPSLKHQAHGNSKRTLLLFTIFGDDKERSGDKD